MTLKEKTFAFQQKVFQEVKTDIYFDFNSMKDR